MTDSEKRKHKSIFFKLSLAFLSYIVISQGLSILAGYLLGTYAPKLLESSEFVLVLSSVIQYLIAFPILWVLLRKIPKRTPIKTEMNTKRFLKYAVVSVFIVYVGNYISAMIMTNIEAFLGRTPENSVNAILDNTSVIFTALIVGIIGPIVEELMFRKLFIDRLTPYGELTAILFPSLIFGLFHGNLYQFFYAFFLGAVFSYIYLKTGKIVYSTVLHIFINLFCGVLPSLIMGMFDYNEFLELTLAGSLTEEYINANMLPILLLGAYEFIMLGMVGIGIFTFTRSIRDIHIGKGDVRFPKGVAAEVIFFNVGTIVLIAVCLLLMAYNTFAV
jgi:membrane protease YdiL (CAAX protease family)